MGKQPSVHLGELGAFIREQRSTARLSLRRLSELAGISNPYLSQIERGLRRPSAEILQQIARALSISAETLYVQAGILDPPHGGTDLARQILVDDSLSEDQKQVLMRIYLSFRREHEQQAEKTASEVDHHEAQEGSAESAGPVTPEPGRPAGSLQDGVGPDGPSWTAAAHVDAAPGAGEPEPAARAVPPPPAGRTGGNGGSSAAAGDGEATELRN